MGYVNIIITYPLKPLIQLMSQITFQLLYYWFVLSVVDVIPSIILFLKMALLPILDSNMYMMMCTLCTVCLLT